MSQPEIFLSYAWGGESEQIVNDLDKAFKVKDITHLEYYKHLVQYKL